MSAAAERGAMIPVTREMRAFFAPVDRMNEMPTIFDPAVGEFLLDAPPAPMGGPGMDREFCALVRDSKRSCALWRQGVRKRTVSRPSDGES